MNRKEWKKTGEVKIYYMDEEDLLNFCEKHNVETDILGDIIRFPGSYVECTEGERNTVSFDADVDSELAESGLEPEKYDLFCREKDGEFELRAKK